MKKHIFTFGSGQLYEGFYQPIYADCPNKARARMVEIYGVKWSHQYTEEQWRKFSDTGIGLEQPMKAIYCESE